MWTRAVAEILELDEEIKPKTHGDVEISQEEHGDGRRDFRREQGDVKIRNS